MTDSRKYIFAFLITAAIFATALFISNFFSQKRLTEISQLQDQLSLEILASETQSALLEETSCQNVSINTPMSRELGDLAEKLSIAEDRSGPQDPNVINLKKQYSLLEMREYLLMKRITSKCGLNPTFILYFYSNEGDCADCQKMGYVLTSLHERFPDLRIYSFDANLDLEAIRTLRSIYALGPELPALVVNGDPYYGFRPIDETIQSIPALRRLANDQLKASSSPAGTTVR